MSSIEPLSESDSEKLRRRNRELSILNSIAEALNRSVNLAEALQVALAQVAALLDLHAGWIWLLNGDGGDSYLAAAQDLPPALANSPHRMAGSCYCLDTYRAGDLSGAANVNVVACSRLKSLIDGTDGLRYHASIPLYATGGAKVGVLNVASPDWRELSEDDLRILHTVGDLLGIAVERARLFEQSAQVGAVEERNRLAREIHDTLAQGLAALVLQLESADAILEAGREAPKARAAVLQALALTRVNLEEARRSVLDLRAAPLEGRSLVEALALLAEEQTAGSEIAIGFRTVGGSRPLPVRLEVGLFRIVQEALSNVVQHSAAETAMVTVTFRPDQVWLVVMDDGVGFDPAQVADGRFGLVGLRERAKLLGGWLSIESEAGSGTRIEVGLPTEGMVVERVSGEG